MPATPPPEGGGFDIFLSWGAIYAVLAAAWTGGLGIAAWVWSLGGQVQALKLEVDAQKKLVEENRAMLKSLANALDIKIHDEVGRIESQVERVRDQISALPTRQNIEHSLNNLTMRIDGLLQNRLGKL